MDPHVHAFFTEEMMMYITQYNPQVFIFQQAHTYDTDDQLSAADTADYSDLPDLVDL